MMFKTLVFVYTRYLGTGFFRISSLGESKGGDLLKNERNYYVCRLEFACSSTSWGGLF